MATNYTAEGKVVQYTCGASEEVSSGDVVFVNGIPGIALVDIGNSETGSVKIVGVFELDKDDDSSHGAIFAQGAPVYWNAEEKEACATAGLPLLGFAYEAAGKTDSKVEVLLAGDPKDAPIPVKAGEALAKYDLVYPSGFDADKGILEVKKAEADGAAPLKVAWYILPAAITNEHIGIAKRSLLATDIDTDTPDQGAPVYLSTTAGGWTNSAPTGGGEAVQQVGVVTVSDSTEGEILFLVGDSKAVSVND